MIISAWWHQT